MYGYNQGVGGYPQQQPGVGGYPQQPGGYPMQQQGGVGGYPMQQPGIGGYPMQQPGMGGYQMQQPQGMSQQGGYNMQVGSGYGNQPNQAQMAGGYGMQQQPYGMQQQGGFGMQPGYQPMMPGSSNPSTQPIMTGQMAMGGMPNNIQTGGAGGYGMMGSYNCENDCATLKKAMKGIGTDEKAIINVLANRTSQQRVEIRNKYKALFGKDLIKELKSELSGSFEDAIVAMMYSQVEYDAYMLYKAMDRIGTDEGVLIEVIGTRSPQQLREIKEVFQREYKKDLVKYVESETSGHFKKILVAILQCQRHDNNFPVDQNVCYQEAQQLYSGGQGRWGTDEGIFTKIFATRSNMEIYYIATSYQQLSGRNLLDALDSEFSGDAKKLLRALFYQAINTPEFFAERLYDACNKNKKDKIIRIIVSRSEVDLTQIKQAYYNKYHRNLAEDIKKSCSGDLERLMLAILNRP
jgi:hypothetical protein